MRLRDNDANFGIGTLAFEARASGERAMWGVQPPLRRGAIAITLVACVGFAAAQSGRRGVGDTDASAMDETTGSVASPGGKRAGLALSEEQRGRIYEGVMRSADAPVAPARRPRSPMRCRVAWRCRIYPPA